jgi:hypothetical protein
MARRNLSEEMLDDVAEELGWTKARKLEVLLDFLADRDLAADFGDFLEEVAETEENEDDEESNEDE